MTRDRVGWRGSRVSTGLPHRGTLVPRGKQGPELRTRLPPALSPVALALPVCGAVGQPAREKSAILRFRTSPQGPTAKTSSLTLFQPAHKKKANGPHGGPRRAPEPVWPRPSPTLSALGWASSQLRVWGFRVQPLCSAPLLPAWVLGPVSRETPATAQGAGALSLQPRLPHPGCEQLESLLG